MLADELSSDRSTRLARCRFRSWHRGTREADYIMGSFFDHHHSAWNEADLRWFEDLLEEDDADVMAWALRTTPAPARFAGRQLEAIQRLDYVRL